MAVEEEEWAGGAENRMQKQHERGGDDVQWVEGRISYNHQQSWYFGRSMYCWEWDPANCEVGEIGVDGFWGETESIFENDHDTLVDEVRGQ